MQEAGPGRFPFAVGLAKVDQRAGDWPQEAFVQISESQTGRAIRTKRWTYSVKAPGGGDHPGSDVYHEEYLYDLASDPYQRRNLVREAAYAGVRAELAATLKRRMVAAGEQEPEVLAA